MKKNVDESSKDTQIKLRRRILSLKGLCIGLMAGLLAVCFRLSLEFAEKMRTIFIDFSVSNGQYYLLGPVVLFGLLIAIVVFITSKFEPDAGGSGIPHLKGYLSGLMAFHAKRIIFVKFIGGVIGMGSGLALGREGPTVQMGSAIAKIMGDYTASSGFERKILVSAGAGAGLAAAFNAPLAGVFFVIEELQCRLDQSVLVTAFAACVTADVICRIIIGELPVFHISIVNYPTINMIPSFLLLGIFLGLAGFCFNKIILASSACMKTTTYYKKTLFSLLVGISLGLIGLRLPEALGTGTDIIKHVFSNEVALYQLLFLFMLRLLVTTISYSTGAPGGIFAPLLVLGVLAGSFFGYIVFLIYPEASFDFSVWSILGMAGFFSAVIRAPITGIVLILEMTNAHNLLLPLMIVSIVSYGIPEYFKDKPIYHALLQQDLSRIPTR